jgi:hypothetical protein
MLVYNKHLLFNMQGMNINKYCRITFIGLLHVANKKQLDALTITTKQSQI